MAGSSDPREKLERERLMHEREMGLAALDAAILRGIADADAGRLHDLDLVASELDAEF